MSELPVWLRAITALPVLAVAALGLAAALLLHRLLLDVAAGKPFAPRNPRRLRALALLAVVYAVLPGALAGLASAAVLGRVEEPGGLALGFPILDVSLPPFLLAGVLLVMAEVFRHGGALADDVEGLV